MYTNPNTLADFLSQRVTKLEAEVSLFVGATILLRRFAKARADTELFQRQANRNVTAFDTSRP